MDIFIKHILFIGEVVEARTTELEVVPVTEFTIVHLELIRNVLYFVAQQTVKLIVHICLP